ncbi:MAG: prepilin-type N-terminal cleavage/methylation domain-containing protein [Gemmatimonadota bacterium]|jgi:type IV pilus assembly protein PilA
MLKHREGFTLIELLIVVVIIGILAAIAIPKFSKTREKAYVSAMQSDLRNLQTSEEIYYSDPANAYQYTSATMTPGQSNAGLEFAPSQGVTIVVAAGSNADGPYYSAVATHASGISTSCSVIVGSVSNAHAVQCS